MFWWLLLTRSRQGAMRVTHTLILSQGRGVDGPNIQGGLPRNYPIEFARTTDGFLYFASGLSDVTKWDGLSLQVEESGVNAPTGGPTLAFSGSGGSITGSYQAYVRYLDADGNVSNLSDGSEIVVASGATTVLYTDVPVPTDENVVRRQILRNTAGNFLTFYVDVDTVNLFATSFTSTKTDTALLASEPVPFFDDQGVLNIVNFHDPPPDDKPFISFYQNRLWLYGIVEYNEGNAQVTNGSTTVTIIGGQVNDSMVNRLLHVDDADRYYTITAVDEEAQTLTIDTSYIGQTDLWAEYTIIPDLNRRHLLCYSEAGQFDSWRANQNIVVASSDDIEDEGTGLISTQSFLFILQRRHIYRLTFYEDPVLDGGIFLSARRGCVNNRCWVSVDGFVYLLDDRGIYRFDGSDAVDEISIPIQDLFYFDRPTGQLRLNWKQSRYWFCSHDRNDSTIRWFVSLSGTRYPRHAICFNYVNPQWWIEEYQWPIGDGTLLRQINPVPVVTSEHNSVFAVGVGTLDNLDEESGDNFSGVASVGTRTIVLSSTTTMPSSLVGTPIGITSGRGKNQVRLIVAASGRALTLDRPWTIKPNTLSKVRLGAIPYRWRSHWMRWMPGDNENTRRMTVSFEPVTEATVDIRVYEDYSKTPKEFAINWPTNSAGSSGVITLKDDPDAVLDLSLTRGFGYLQLDSRREYNVWRKDVVSLELKGMGSDEPIQFYAIDVEGAFAGGGFNAGGRREG